ncbi:MAG: hypothetical protein V1694_04275 [Candidatus Eisenbacteria bacterium]
MLICGDGAGVTPGAPVKLLDIEGRVVRQRVHLEVRPESLHGVQLGSVGRQKGRMDGVIAALENRSGGSMDIQPVPHEDYRRTELASDLPEKPE